MGSQQPCVSGKWTDQVRLTLLLESVLNLFSSLSLSPSLFGAVSKHNEFSEDGLCLSNQGDIAPCV
jgi:hypothetical protein